MPGCKFCMIARHQEGSNMVFEDDISVAFLDKRPVFPGHTLVIPIKHYETLKDLPVGIIGRFFTNVQLISVAVESGMKADGTFVAMNNRVSQSVPHLHVHVVPRRAQDGLKGLFWPRRRYSGPEEELRVRDAIKKEIDLRIASA